MIPILGYVAGDRAELLIYAYETDTIAQLIDKVQQAATVSTRPPKTMSLLFKGRKVPLDATVAEVGFSPKDVVELIPCEQTDFSHPTHQ